MCAQLAASQATSDGADRVLALGRLSMSYTIGAILGPAIGTRFFSLACSFYPSLSLISDMFRSALCRVLSYSPALHLTCRVLGGYLGATGDYYLGAKIAVGGSLISVVLALLIPSHTVSHSSAEHNVNNNDVDDEDEALLMGDSVKAEDAGKGDVEGLVGGVGSRSFDNLQMKPRSGVLQSIMNQGAAMMSVVRIVWLLLSVKIVSGVANSMMSETFPLVLKDIFSLNEQSLGLAIAANSAFNGVVNGLLLAPLVGYAGGDLIAVITVCLTLMTGIALTLSAVSLPSFSPFLLLSKLTDSPISAVAPVTTSSNGLHLYLGLTFVLSIFQYALSTTITGESTSLVRVTQKGTLLGVEHSFFALARIVAPQVGVMLLKMGGVSAVASVSGGVYFAVSLLWSACKQSLKGKRQAVKTPITVKGAGSNGEGGVRGPFVDSVDERKGR